MSVLSIDPGLSACGVAAWDEEHQLVWAGYVKNVSGGDFSSMVTAVRAANRYTAVATDIVIELPQVYVRTRSKGDPNDLVSLAVLVGAFVGQLCARNYVLYKPHEWKGSVPKEIMVGRIQKRLTDGEKSKVVLPAVGLAHNVWDAVGLGLHHLGRL